MKSYLKIFIFSLFLMSLFVTACDDDDDTTDVNLTEVLVKYLEQDGDFINTSAPAMITAEAVKTSNTAGKAYVIDIRSADDFADGHIPGAINVGLADIITHVTDADLSAYEDVVIACYSGQTASYATSILRMLGFDKVKCLKFGMSSWHLDFAGPWNNGVGNTYATQFETDATAMNAEGELPEFTSTSTEGSEILTERVEAILGDWSTDAKIQASVVFSNLESYYIVNYWPQDHYDLGHIPGAIQYTPKSAFKLANDLKTLPTDKPIVVYCYTGQTSAHIAAFLRVLGYDAKSLLYGVNGMAYDWATGHGMTHWDESYIMGYDYETK